MRYSMRLPQPLLFQDRLQFRAGLVSGQWWRDGGARVPKVNCWMVAIVR